MRSQSDSNLRYVHCGVAVFFSMALHVGIVRLRLPVQAPPVTSQEKTPPTIPQQAVQVRPHTPEPILDAPTPEPPPKKTPPPVPAEPPPVAPQPAATPSTPSETNSVAIEPEVRQQKPDIPSSPPQTQSKLVEEDPPASRQPDDEPDASQLPDSDPSQPPEELLAQQWDGLISTIQTEEAGFGQAQLLQDIFLNFGQDDQFDLFFDQDEQPKINIISYQLFTDLTPQQVWEEKVQPTLKRQDSIEITEVQTFAAGKVYRISQGEFVRYLNVVPLYQPKEVVLLEMTEAPSKES